MMGDRRLRWFLAGGLLVTLVLAGAVSFYASSQPDGLEKVAEDKGFLETATDHATADSPFADYGVSGVDNDRASVGLAGVIGVAITLVVAGGLFVGLRAVRRRTGRPGSGPPEPGRRQSEPEPGVASGSASAG